jgi:excisionase family DNA binding protein
MSQELCTVEFAAEQLKLHPKTVLRFIRSGRLRATRVGKSYRIARADLDALAGVESPPAQTAAWMTSIVDVPSVGPELARRWAQQVPSALSSKPADRAPLRADVVYDPAQSHLKIIVVGPPAESVELLMLIRVWLEQLRA